MKHLLDTGPWAAQHHGCCWDRKQEGQQMRRVSCPEHFLGLGKEREQTAEWSFWVTVTEIPVQRCQHDRKLQGRTAKWVRLHKEKVRSAERASWDLGWALICNQCQRKAIRVRKEPLASSEPQNDLLLQARVGKEFTVGGMGQTPWKGLHWVELN